MVSGLNAAAGWRTAYASVTGTSHLKTGSPCQDAGRCAVIHTSDGSETLVAAASDGAGTASHSAEGANLAVDAFIAEFGAAVLDDPEMVRIDRTFVCDWITRFQSRIDRLADAEGGMARDYACTLLGAVISEKCAVYVQVGDGAIIVGTEEPDHFAYVAWPQHGEYANVTNFLTQKHATKIVEFEKGKAVDEVALFTDGLERLVLDIAHKSVHSPAFRPVFAWLRTCEPSAPETPSEALTAFLASDHVSRRTDDDKTLVMATRRAAGPCGGENGPDV